MNGKVQDLHKSRFDLLNIFSGLSLIYFVFLTFVLIFYPDNTDVPIDWHTFWDTAVLFAEGSYYKLYPGITPGLPFLYPPYVPLFIFPLSFFPKDSAYIILILFNFVLMFLSFQTIWKITSVSLATLLKLSIVAVTSASWHVIIALGHFSTLYLFLLCLALYLQTIDKRFASGVILSFLMLKPNIGILFPILFFVRRDHKTLLGWTLGMISLCLLPFFYRGHLWTDYYQISLTIGGILYQIPPWKHHTLHACLRSMLTVKNLGLVPILWFMAAGVLTVNCIYVWYKTAHVGVVMERLFSIAVLTIIVCNPYFYHYDAIIVVLPAVIFYCRRNDYFYKTTRPIVAFSLFSAFICQHMGVFYIKGGVSLVSIPLAIWLISESLDLYAEIHYGIPDLAC